MEIMGASEDALYSPQNPKEPKIMITGVLRA